MPEQLETWVLPGPHDSSLVVTVQGQALLWHVSICARAARPRGVEGVVAASVEDTMGSGTATRQFVRMLATLATPTQLQRHRRRHLLRQVIHMWLKAGVYSS